MKEIIYNYKRKEAYITESCKTNVHKISKEIFGHYITHNKLTKIRDGHGYIWFKIEPTK